MSAQIKRWVLIAALLAVPSLGQAQIDFGADRSQVFSIQKRPYRLGHEFQLGVGVLPLDSFYTGILISGAYTYHFSDFWGWEIAGAGFSLNIDTDLEASLLEDFELRPTESDILRAKWFFTSSLVVKPLFGKLAVFNSDIVYAETLFNIGIGPYRIEEFTRPALSMGMGLRFWTSQAISWRFDIKDQLVFINGVHNILVFMLSASLNVHDATEAPEG